MRCGRRSGSDHNQWNQLTVPAEITYLEVRLDAESHAKRFGAQRDSFGRWYVTGQVPNELLNYLPRKAGRRTEEPPPECPLCRSEMRKATSSSGNLYWFCTARSKTGCSGTIDYVKYLEQAALLPAIGELASGLAESFISENLSSLDASRGTGRGTHPLKNRWLEIVELAFAVLGNERQVMRWMTQPKLALGRQAPIRKLGTAEGCDTVERLLRELWD